MNASYLNLGPAKSDVISEEFYKVSTIQLEFYISHLGQELGPYQVETIISLLKRGKIQLEDYLYSEEVQDWVCIAEYEPIASRLRRDFNIPKIEPNPPVSIAAVAPDIPPSNDAQGEPMSDARSSQVPVEAPASDSNGVDPNIPKLEDSLFAAPNSGEAIGEEITEDLVLDFDTATTSSTPLPGLDALVDTEPDNLLESMVNETAESQSLPVQNEVESASEGPDENIFWQQARSSIKSKPQSIEPILKPTTRPSADVTKQETKPLADGSILDADFLGTIQIVDGVGVFEISSLKAEKMELSLEPPPDKKIEIQGKESLEFVADRSARFALTIPPQARVGDTVTAIIRAEDAYGNQDTRCQSSVFLQLSGSATGGGLIRIRNGYGEAHIGNSVAEPIELTLKDVEKSGIDVSAKVRCEFLPTEVHHLAISEVKDAIVGERVTVIISAEDAYGNLTPEFEGRTQLVATGATQGAGTVEIKNGQGVIEIYNLKAERVELKLVDRFNLGLSLGAVRSLSFRAGPAIKLVIKSPTSTTAGVTETIVIEAQDVNGNVDRNAQLRTTLKATGQAQGAGIVEIVNGYGRKDLTDNVAETISLTLEDTFETKLNTQMATEILVAPAEPAQILFLPIAGATVGHPVSVRLQVQDRYGNAVRNFSGEIAVRSSSQLSGLGVVSLKDGEGVLKVESSIAEEVELSLDDTKSLGIKASSKIKVRFNSGTAVRATLVAPKSATVATRVSVRIEAQDELGNIDHSFFGRFQLAASVQCQGLGTIEVIKGIGEAKISHLTAEKVSLSLVQDSGADHKDLDLSDRVEILLVSGPATQVMINAQNLAKAGEPILVEILAQDEHCNVDERFNGAVTLRATGSCQGGGVVQLSKGRGSTEVSNTVAEVVELSLSDPLNSGLDVSRTHRLEIEAGEAIKVLFVKVDPAVAGKKAVVAIEAHDRYGNIDKKFNASVGLKKIKTGS